MLAGVGHGSVLIVGLVKSWLSMFFLSVRYTIPTHFFRLFETNSSTGCI